MAELSTAGPARQLGGFPVDVSRMHREDKQLVAPMETANRPALSAV